jgi:hypothetical protein
MIISPKIKIGFGLAIVFVAGAVCGSVGTLKYNERLFTKAMRTETWAAAVLKGLDNDLNLSEEQHEKARVMLDASVNEALVSMRQLGTVLVELHSRINEILTPEQKAKNIENFEKFRRGLKDRFQIELPQEPSTNSAAQPKK